MPLAGGTDLYVALNAGTLPARVFLDVWGLRELRGIRRRAGGGLVIGAGATFAEIAASAAGAPRSYRCWSQAARQIGGAQIQNRATLGGNVANASPAADAVPILLAVEATLVLVSAAAASGGCRSTEFYTGYRRTQLRAGRAAVRDRDPAACRGGPGSARWARGRRMRSPRWCSRACATGRLRGWPSAASAPTTVRLPRTEAALGGGGIDRTTPAAVLLDGDHAHRRPALDRAATAGRSPRRCWRSSGGRPQRDGETTSAQRGHARRETMRDDHRRKREDAMMQVLLWALAVAAGAAGAFQTAANSALMARSSLGAALFLNTTVVWLATLGCCWPPAAPACWARWRGRRASLCGGPVRVRGDRLDHRRVPAAGRRRGPGADGAGAGHGRAGDRQLRPVGHAPGGDHRDAAGGGGVRGRSACCCCGGEGGAGGSGRSGAPSPGAQTTGTSPGGGGEDLSPLPLGRGRRVCAAGEGASILLDPRLACGNFGRAGAVLRSAREHGNHSAGVAATAGRRCRTPPI